MKQLLLSLLTLFTLSLVGCKDADSVETQKDYPLAVVCHGRILEFKMTHSSTSSTTFTLHIHAYQHHIPAQTRIFAGQQLLIETKQETDLLEIPLPQELNVKNNEFKISFSPYSPLHTITISGDEFINEHCHHCSDPSCHATHHH